MRKNLVSNPDVLTASQVVISGEQWYLYGKGFGAFTDCGYVEGTAASNSTNNADYKGNRKGVAKLVKRTETERTETYKFNSASTGNMAVRAAFYGGVARQGTANGKAFAPNAPAAVDDLVLVGSTLLRVTVAGTTDAKAPDVTTTKAGDVVSSGDTVRLVSLGSADANTIYTLAGGNRAQDVSAICVLSTEDSEGADGTSVIIVMPNAQAQGTGQPKVQNYDGYEFTVTLADNTTFAPLPQYGEFTDTYPDSVVVVVPNSRVEEVASAYAEALKTYRDAL